MKSTVIFVYGLMPVLQCMCDAWLWCRLQRILVRAVLESSVPDHPTLGHSRDTIPSDSLW